ncbi:MAG: DUF4054 domain-containing protein [Rhodospirillaceae bacterium]|nr:MAG: DUF4054 domain-containing protein [Rhodospirillaceae bacterium]
MTDTITHGEFVAAFPEFADAAKYPKPQVAFWIEQAPTLLNARSFGKSWKLAQMLFVAHNIVLSARNVQAGSGGGIAGMASGPMSSKTVGQVSASYDTGAVALKDAGAWNATSFGQRLYTMIKAVGSGPIYRAPPARRTSF